MRTLGQLLAFLEPHVAHFIYAFTVTFGAVQVVFGGSTFDVATQHGAVAFVVAFGMALWRAFEASGNAPAGPAGA